MRQCCLHVYLTLYCSSQSGGHKVVDPAWSISCEYIKLLSCCITTCNAAPVQSMYVGNSKSGCMKNRAKLNFEICRDESIQDCRPCGGLFWKRFMCHILVMPLFFWLF